MSEMMCGNPWHGPINGSGQITLPNGGTRHVGLPTGGCSLLKFSGLPVPTTTAAEAALGMEWRNYALISGRKIHNEYPLGGFTWLYRNSDGEVWRLRFEPTSWPPGPYAMGDTATAGYRIMARRFGVIGAATTDEVEIYSGSLSWPVMYESTPYFIGFWMTFSPDGSHALVHVVMRNVANTANEASYQSVEPWYVVSTQPIAANAAFEISVANTSPPTVFGVAAVAIGAGVRETVTVGLPPLAIVAMAYKPTIYSPYVVALGYRNSGGSYSVMPGGVTSASFDYTETARRFVYGTYAPDGTLCLYRFDLKNHDTSHYGISGTVTDDGTGYSITLGFDFHSEQTVTHSIMANGVEQVAVDIVSENPLVGSVASSGYVDPPSWPQNAHNLIPNVRNKSVDGIDIYVNGTLVNSVAANYQPYPRLMSPMLAAVGLYHSTEGTQWRRACSPVSTYDHGSYTTEGLVWHPVQDTWWPASTGVLGFV